VGMKIIQSPATVQIASWGIALAFLFTGMNVAYATTNKKCTATPLAAIDLVIDGPTLVPVTLNGQPAWMILQTEAAMTLIRQDAVGTLQLPTRVLGKDGLQVAIGGRHITQMASTGPLLIGGLRIPRTDFFVDPFPHASLMHEGRPVAGSLAMDTLWPFDFELDLANKRLAFYSPSSCGGPGLPWADHLGRMPMDLTALGDIYFTVEIEGKKLETSIATSVDSSRMGIDISRQLSAASQQSADSNEPDSSVSGEVLTEIIKLASGGLVIPERIQLTKAPPKACSLSERPEGVLGYDGCYGRYPLVLGRNALQKLHLYFATKEKVIYFTVAGVQ
jgi:hypothetical protein